MNHQIIDSTPSSTWTASLMGQARILMDQNRVVEDNNMNYVKPCSVVTDVQETLTTLLVARVDGRGQTSSERAHQALESLLSVQGKNGILPKYRYSPDRVDDENDYLPDSMIPSPRVFDDNNKSQSRYSPPQDAHHDNTSSLRLSAIPLHASVVYDLFLWSQQTREDVVRLSAYFERLYNYHDLLHSVVMRGCQKERGDSSPCYNVIHPWETLLDRDSPIWKKPFQQFQTRNKFSTTSDDDELLMSLANCMTNATSQCAAAENHDDRQHLLSEHHHRQIDQNCEDRILQQCPFAVLDVGYTAALYKSNVDLLRMARLLQTQSSLHSSVVGDLHITQLTQWKEQSEHVLLNELWNDQHQSFMSKYVVWNNDDNTTSLEWLDDPAVSNTFMVEWSRVFQNDQRSAVLSHMLQSTGNDSFACGEYPLWSIGGCTATMSATALIDPILNHVVSIGLRSGGELEVGQFLSDSTLRLVCGLDNTVEQAPNVTCDNVTFPALYRAATATPFTRTACDATSTATAAVVLDMLLPELPHHKVSPPPIRTSWAIVLVVIEQVVAASIALSCLVLSLRMLRRLNDTQSEEYVQMLTTPAHAEGGYFFSATASFASDENDGDQENGPRGE